MIFAPSTAVISTIAPSSKVSLSFSGIAVHTSLPIFALPGSSDVIPENESDTFEEGTMVEITAVDGAKIVVRSHQ